MSACIDPGCWLPSPSCSPSPPARTIGRPEPSPTSVALPAQATPPALRCHKSGSVPATGVTLAAADGTALVGVRFGTGPRGVLLLPQREADLCGWWDYAVDLSTQGFQALALDMRGTGLSGDGPTQDFTADAIAGIALLKRSGAQKVVVIGASQGAATAIVTAARVPDQVAGVVSLSYPADSLDVTGGAGANPHTPAQAAASSPRR